MPLTVTRLARACGLSRTTVLYYESLGLLRPARRTPGNYRAYGHVVDVGSCRPGVQSTDRFGRAADGEDRRA